MYTYFRDQTVDLGVSFPLIDCFISLLDNSMRDAGGLQNKKRSTSVAAASDNNSSAHSAGLRSGETTREEAVRPAASETSSLERRRPTGTKRAHQDKQHCVVLKSDADGISRPGEASLKRNKVAEELIAVEKQQSFVALFSMPSTNTSLCHRFIQISQLKEIYLL